MPGTPSPGKKASGKRGRPRTAGGSRAPARGRASGGRRSTAPRRRSASPGPGKPHPVLYATAAALVLAALAGAVWLLGVFPARPGPGAPDSAARDSALPTGRMEPVPENPGAPGTYPETAPPARDTAPERPSAPEAVPERPAAAVRGPGGVPERPRPPKGRIVLVIDDAGYNLAELEPFLKFPGPLSIAVLPRLPYSEEAARRIKAAGKEVLLHQPMEALGGENPGPGAIRPGMNELEVAAIVAENLATVPGATGMNNHMGSAVSRDPDTMRAVLEAARASGLYYLDSLTVSDSVVHSVASHLNLKTWERDVFLDNYPERAAILKQFDDGVKGAEKKGLSVMIGHVWSAQLAQTLVDLYPGLIEQGFSLSTISRIMLEDSDEDSGD